MGFLTAAAWTSNGQLHTYRHQLAKQKEKKENAKSYAKKNKPAKTSVGANKSPAVASGFTIDAYGARVVRRHEYKRHENITGLVFRIRREPVQQLPGVAESMSTLSEILKVQHSLLNDNSTYCTREKFMCKYTPECTPRPPPCIGKVFITGCSGSGTHAVWSTLQSTTDSGTTVTHEKSRQGTTVLVSWPTRCVRAMENTDAEVQVKLDYGKYGFTQADMKPPMVQWAQKQLNGLCAYQTIVHVVRHPLSFLSSNLAFGQCIECWTLVEQFSVPPISRLTKNVRAAILHNRKQLYEQRGGRVWDEKTRGVLLEAYMLYWVTWNRMTESVADMRFRIEHTELRELCALLGLGSKRQCMENEIKKLKTGGHGGFKDAITWEQTEAINAEMAKAVWKLAKHYGYQREVPKRYTLPPGMNERDDSSFTPGRSKKKTQQAGGGKVGLGLV
jgi:hypothetical protein